jgi:hypothetical protein
MKTGYKLTVPLLMASILFGCGGDPDPNVSIDTTRSAEVSINQSVFDEMIYTLPQPIEIADIISKSNMEFSSDLLVPSANGDGFNSKYTQAMALGAYGVDLGYINLNDKTLYSIDYLESVQHVAAKLKVDQFFDFTTLSELARQQKNADSLLKLSTQNFNNIDQYLRDNNRGELSILILVGAWIEGMHMFGEIYKETSDTADMKNRIAEQKVIFDNIYAITERLEQIAFFAELKTEMQPLKQAYDKVTITYEYHEPETKEVNGELVIIDKSETKISAANATIDEIIKGVHDVRHKYLLTVEIY